MSILLSNYYAKHTLYALTVHFLREIRDGISNPLKLDFFCHSMKLNYELLQLVYYFSHPRFIFKLYMQQQSFCKCSGHSIRFHNSNVA